MPIKPNPREINPITMYIIFILSLLNMKFSPYEIISLILRKFNRIISF